MSSLPAPPSKTQSASLSCIALQCIHQTVSQGNAFISLSHVYHLPVYTARHANNTSERQDTRSHLRYLSTDIPHIPHKIEAVYSHTQTQTASRCHATGTCAGMGRASRFLCRSSSTLDSTESITICPSWPRIIPMISIPLLPAEGGSTSSTVMPTMRAFPEQDSTRVRATYPGKRNRRHTAALSSRYTTCSPTPRQAAAISTSAVRRSSLSAVRLTLSHTSTSTTTLGVGRNALLWKNGLTRGM
mmetsp:Transcript_46398/g.115428  ORF Transcript_46398/g.115428 Transcript_46398/m.115428 type:complete len:244 (-) Transcript_46398:199-930(-)